MMSLDVKIDHHEFDELQVELSEPDHNMPQITIGHKGARDQITLTLDELDTLVALSERFRASLIAFENAGSKIKTL